MKIEREGEKTPQPITNLATAILLYLLVATATTFLLWAAIATQAAPPNTITKPPMSSFVILFHYIPSSLSMLLPSFTYCSIVVVHTNTNSTTVKLLSKPHPHVVWFPKTLSSIHVFGFMGLHVFKIGWVAIKKERRRKVFEREECESLGLCLCVSGKKEEIEAFKYPLKRLYFGDFKKKKGGKKKRERALHTQRLKPMTSSVVPSMFTTRLIP